MLAGLLLVRSMAKPEYAWFTVVNGAMATIAILADSGLGSAFTAIGGKTFQDRAVFASLAKLVRRKRLQFLTLAAGVTLPLVSWALLQNGASVGVTITLSLMIFLAAVLATDAVVLMTVNKLFKRVRNIVVADLTVSLTKLLLVVAICLIGVSAVGATMCLLVALWLQIIVLRRQTADVLTTNEGLNSDDAPANQFRAQINQTVAHVVPISVFTCLQAQLATYILSFFATSSQVADLGALMRVAVAFTFLALPLSHLFLPAIARCQDRAKLRDMICQTILGFSAAAVLIVAAGYLLTPILLAILGDHYTHLRSEMLLFLAVSALGFVTNSVWGVALARAWVIRGWTAIPLTIALQVAVAPFIDFTQVSGVILFTASSYIVSLGIAIWLVLTGYRGEFMIDSNNPPDSGQAPS